MRVPYLDPSVLELISGKAVTVSSAMGGSDLKRRPDFIIGGAPKCGTSSLHTILDAHEDIGMPPVELHFFDRDDPIVHPDFFPGNPDFQSRDPFNPENLKRYEMAFEPYSHLAKLGEDSTTYLQSPAAASRIKSLVPDVKMIFLLRDPVARAYSQYWHMVSRSRATQGFEKTITTYPWILLGSTYLDPLRRYFSTLERENIMVCLFEDFVANKQGFVDKVVDFIGVERFDITGVESWTNRSLYPSNLRAKLLLNQIGKHAIAGQYDDLSSRASASPTVRKRVYNLWQAKFSHRLMRSGKPPAMSHEARAYLERQLSARNDGLSELLGYDLPSIWKGFSG